MAKIKKNGRYTIHNLLKSNW